jgi:pyruvate/2-oxoglutarate dehydrogenase complex dihydrolipoamide dehydrogenase (E3) component
MDLILLARETYNIYPLPFLLQCVPSKALLRAAKAIREVRRSAEFGIRLPGDIQIDFPTIMQRLRKLRLHIAPADGHAGTTSTGAHVFQGYGRFTGPNTLQVERKCDDGTTETVELHFRKAVVATGGRPAVPKNIPGLLEAPYTTNEILFNLSILPDRMVILGAGIIALEMAQCFATFGSHVTVIQRSERLFASTQGDMEAATLLQEELEASGVKFVQGKVSHVETLRERDANDPSLLPLIKVLVALADGSAVEFDCECLLVATGRAPNIENLGLEVAGVEYKADGVVVNDLAQSVSNPNIYAVGDCVAGVPRLTHMSGEMAKLVVQNSLFADNWTLSSLVVPAVMYTEPEYATVGISSEERAIQLGIAVDTYRAGLEHNDRAILESSNRGFCKVFCRSGTDEIVGAVIVAERAGEMINEISLAIKQKIGLRAIGRNIHSYPTTGEAVMGCGIQYINSHWQRLNE